MELIMQLVALAVIINVLFFCYIHGRLNQQDKYISTYIKAMASHKNSDEFTISPIELDTSKPEDKKKPEVYSPRHDQETIMQGKVIDPFD